MMPPEFPERDWQLLRKLKPPALERLCQRGLDAIAVIMAGSQSSHDRYLAIYALVQQHDEEIARAFDDLRRSNGLLRLSAMRSLNLISDEELRHFSEETQARINLLCEMSPIRSDKVHPTS